MYFLLFFSVRSCEVLCRPIPTIVGGYTNKSDIIRIANFKQLTFQRGDRAGVPSIAIIL